MNPTAAAALTTALVWSNMIDAIGESPCGFKLQVRSRIAKPWLVKNQ
jgi:hypothetical protein